MKQYFAILAVLFTAILSSCSNDDIEIIESSNFELNISTQSVYDEFDIAESFKNMFLGGKGYSIGVYSYIYDTEGNLVTSDSTYVDTFGLVRQEFNGLHAGDYTLVTLEMLVEKDNDNLSPNWRIVGQDRLGTIAIKNTNFESYWYSAVGLYTDQFSVSKGVAVKNVTPKGIGCVLQTYYMNFDLSKYSCVNFFTKDQPNGRMLSPQITGQDRFVYDHYNERNVWTDRGFQYRSGGLNNEESLGIYLLEEGTIRYCFGAQSLLADGKLDINFYPFPSASSTFDAKDGAIYYGGFIYTGGREGNDCQAGLFDTDKEFISWYKEVIANTTSYIKPYLSWGASASQVNTYMTNAGLQVSDSGSNNETEVYWTVYSNKANSVFYEYHFDLNQNNLNTVFMLFAKQEYTFDEIKSDLSQTYGTGEYSSELNGYIFASADTLLLLSEDEDLITVLYIPNSSGSPKKILGKITRYRHNS